LGGEKDLLAKGTEVYQFRKQKPNPQYDLRSRFIHCWPVAQSRRALKFALQQALSRDDAETKMFRRYSSTGSERGEDNLGGKTYVDAT
jgi:hypothetical protein